MTICAIHQPNFFPWAGYFDKIKKADIFIFLDEVAYPKSGSGTGSWCNRVKMLSNNQSTWFGLPIKRQSGVQLIKDVEFVDREYNVKKLLKLLEYNYKKALGYSKLFSIIEPLMLYSQNNLVEYNINAIMTLADYLGLKTKFIRQSELKHTKHSTELLIELIQQVGANIYLCGMGSSGYQDDALFSKAGITLCYQSIDFIEQFSNIKSDDKILSILHLLLSYEYSSNCIN